MATYKSKPVTVQQSAVAISDKFADLSTLEGALGDLPESERAKIGEVKFTADSLSIKTAQVGELKFQVTERTPERVVFNTGELAFASEHGSESEASDRRQHRTLHFD